MSNILDKLKGIVPGFKSGVIGETPMETKHIWMIGAGILILAVLIYFIYQFFSKNNVEAFHPNRENVPVEEEGQANKTATMMIFHVDWCPHCKTAMPEWEKVRSKHEGKTINGYKIHFADYNCTKESPETDELLDKYKIEGYPTIKLVKDGQIIEYDAKPTESTIDQFLNTVL
uniref:Thioredoxin domain-containing protein n=1 Tax=viral metagenome TaxID=1070528 RepID=A0A6C0I7K1_9ZZZZ